MKKLSHVELQSLATVRGPCVTVFLRFSGNRVRDYHHVQSRITQCHAGARLRFPSMASAFDSVDVDSIFALRSSVENWSHAVYFKSNEVQGIYPLFRNFSEAAECGERFYLNPLFDLIQFKEKFNVLWVWEDKVRHFVGNFSGLTMTREFPFPRATNGLQTNELHKQFLPAVTQEMTDFPGWSLRVSDAHKNIGRAFALAAPSLNLRDVLKGLPTVLVGEAALTPMFLNTAPGLESVVHQIDTSDLSEDCEETIHHLAMESLAHSTTGSAPIPARPSLLYKLPIHRSVRGEWRLYRSRSTALRNVGYTALRSLELDGT
ncbi:MAG: hypothetical protein NTV34_16565 [Proteobacteria bacterium]|nr:hypothetical protein [Pseudomonadota bacterium]